MTKRYEVTVHQRITEIIVEADNEDEAEEKVIEELDNMSGYDALMFFTFDVKEIEDDD